jgi:hypothetical protein
LLRNAAAFHRDQEALARQHDRRDRPLRPDGCGASAAGQQREFARGLARAYVAKYLLLPIPGEHDNLGATRLDDVERVCQIALAHEHGPVREVAHLGRGGQHRQILVGQVHEQRHPAKTLKIHVCRLLCCPRLHSSFPLADANVPPVSRALTAVAGRGYLVGQALVAGPSRAPATRSCG